MPDRRGFLGAVAALAAAPWWPKRVATRLGWLFGRPLYWHRGMILDVLTERDPTTLPRRHGKSNVALMRAGQLRRYLEDLAEGEGMGQVYGSECRSCHAAIRWVRTHKGKSMPLDPEPTRDGCWVMEGDEAEKPKPLVTRLDNDAAALYTGEKFTSHFETCPDARRWSHRNQKGAAK